MGDSSGHSSGKRTGWLKRLTECCRTILREEEEKTFSPVRHSGLTILTAETEPVHHAHSQTVKLSFSWSYGSMFRTSMMSNTVLVLSPPVENYIFKRKNRQTILKKISTDIFFGHFCLFAVHALLPTLQVHIFPLLMADM